MTGRLIPIITEQRRLVEVGRIRLGKKITGTRQDGSAYSRPAKIDKFRLTSRDKDRLDSAAALYGGTVEAWEGKWELYTETDVIPIALVPSQALSLYYELWGQKSLGGDKKSPVICLRRCDGATELQGDGPCICAAEEEMRCRPTVRLSVVLPYVRGLGVWRLESHGWNAATELQGTVELLEALVATGRPVRARLRLDKRESPHEKGTRKFVVPVIDIDHTLSEVLDSLGAVNDLAPIEASSGFRPVAALPAPPTPSVAEQVATASEPVERRPRSNAAEPIKATGLSPRRANELSPRALNAALVEAGLPQGGTVEEMRARLAEIATTGDDSPSSLPVEGDDEESVGGDSSDAVAPVVGEPSEREKVAQAQLAAVKSA